MMALEMKDTGHFSSPEIFSTLEKAKAEATYLYDNASLPAESPLDVVWVSHGSDDPSVVRVFKASVFEEDSNLVIHEIIVDHDQPGR
jgi:hypothetical protein